MRNYTKGCRWFVVTGSVVDARRKTTLSTSIENLIPWRSDPVSVVVQPRGKQQWLLFQRGSMGLGVILKARAGEPDSLIMQALLA